VIHLFDVYSLRPAWAPPLPTEESAVEIRAKRKVVDRVVVELWEQLAAAAWQYYSESGRGLVSLELNELTRMHDGGHLPIGYIKASDLRTSLALDAFDAEVLEEALGDYDPTIEVLVLGRFVKSTMTITVVRRAAHQPAPARASVRAGN
jgi:hypothetical protein